MKQILFSILFLLIGWSAKGQGSVVLLSSIVYDYPTAWDDSVVDFNKSQKGYSRLTNREKEYYYWINYSRKNPKRFWDSICMPIIKKQPALKNSRYAASLKVDLYSLETLPLLRLNDTLITTAANHAKDIAKKHKSISHTSSNGTTFAQRMKNAGINYASGENIGMGPDDMIMSLFLLYLDQGLADLGHRKTLLNPKYLSIGLGVYQKNRTYIINVQDFGSK